MHRGGFRDIFRAFWPLPRATREGRAREGRGVGLGAGLGGGRLRCREGRVTVLIVPSRSSTSSSGGKPQAQHTRAAAHAAREGRGAGCGGGCCEGCVRCREGRLRPRERFLHKVFVTCARARSAARSAARRRAKFSSAARRGLQPGDEGARRWARARRRTICSPARCSACRRGRGRGGLQVHNPASTSGGLGLLGSSVAFGSGCGQALPGGAAQSASMSISL